MIGLSYVVDEHFITLGRSVACPASPELRISEEQKRKITTSCFLCFLSSSPHCYNSSIYRNKVGLLFGLNSKLVPYSRGASPDRLLAAFQVKKIRMKKVSSTTPWQGDFTVIRKSPWRKTRIYPRPTLQSQPSVVPAHIS